MREKTVKGHAFKGRRCGSYDEGWTWDDGCECGWRKDDNWVSEKWARKSHREHKADVIGLNQPAILDTYDSRQ